MSRNPSVRSLYLLTGGYVAAFAVWHVGRSWPEVAGAETWLSALLLLRLLIELVAAFYVFATVLKCLDYGFGAPDPAPAGTGEAGGEPPPVAVVYLTCGDFDPEALRSLCRLRHEGPLDVFIHDDMGDPEAAAALDRKVEVLAAEEGRRVEVLRRPRRTGGKPGAVNHVLRHIADTHPFFLLCDNDSIALTPDAVPRALPAFRDPRTAGVQFRNRGVTAPGDGVVNRLLTRAVEVFDLFARHQGRHGLMPFLGHNGMLRTAAVLDVGAFREGCFADDVDLSVRLALAGYRVRYQPDVTFGEKHPATYAAFRKRAFKWAFGCGQVLRRQLWPVLRSRALGLSEKLGFLEFTGFYLVQVLLLVYLALVGIVLPVAAPESAGAGLWSVTGSALVVGAIFLPALTFFAAQRRLRDWWPFAWVCALVYGSVAFTTAGGVLAGLRDKPREWVPTNAADTRSRPPTHLLEAAFGGAIALVPALYAPDRLLHPALVLFVCVFLFTPLVARFYTPAAAPATATGRMRRRAAVPLTGLLALGLVAGGERLVSEAAAAPAPQGRVTLDDGSFHVEGERFLVKGVSYSPWTPGTGPGKNHPWPPAARIEEDLGLIRDLGANTILVHDAPPSILGRAAAHELMVVYTFFLNWQSIQDDKAFEDRLDEVGALVRELAGHGNLLAILLGNEVVTWVKEEMGRQMVEQRLRRAYERVKKVVPQVPVAHANWPPTRDLDLGFMDFVAFNLYPHWPREVAVKGYETYIREVLLPLAGGRPLLISEFGQNTLEVSQDKQARVLEECWQAVEAHTAGGVVFSFVDEWWKNYNNPVSQEDWWEREHDPDDELRHDLDPEEYYGIFTAQRSPKPAAAVVKRMFTPSGSGSLLDRWTYGVPLLVLLVYTIYVFRRGAARALGGTRS